MQLFPTYRGQRQLSTESPGLARYGEASPLKLAQPRAGPRERRLWTVDSGGQVTLRPRIAVAIQFCGPRARPAPGGRIAALEAAIVTSGEAG
jgi:hypothetical protein